MKATTTSDDCTSDDDLKQSSRLSIVNNHPLAPVASNTDPSTAAAAASSINTIDEAMATNTNLTAKSSTPQTTTTTTTPAMNKNDRNKFIYETNIRLLGIRFLPSPERKNFENEVQNAMNFLLNDGKTPNTTAAVKSSLENQNESSSPLPSTSSSSSPSSSSSSLPTNNGTTTAANIDRLDLPSVIVRIPFALSDDVEIELAPTDVDKYEQLCATTHRNHRDLSLDNGNTDLRAYLHKLIFRPIRVPADQIFLYRGPLNSAIERCLTLTTNFSSVIHYHDDDNRNDDNNKDDAHRHHQHQHQAKINYRQCMVLYADSPASVTDIVDIFRKIHGIKLKTPSPSSSPSPPSPTQHLLSTHQTSPSGCTIMTSTGSTAIAPRLNECKIVMIAVIEIQEEVAEGRWHTAPFDKGSFKLRTHLDKKICITLYQDLTQYCFPVIRIERCFGMLLCSGRNMVSSDMVAIGLNSMNTSTVTGSFNGPHQQWHIVASWIPSELNFEYLNTETTGDSHIFFTIAVDLVIERIDEPVRFVIDARAKIVPPRSNFSVTASATEKFWLNFASKSAKQMQEQFHVTLRTKSPEDKNGDESLSSATSTAATKSSSQPKYEVISCFSSTQIALQKQRLSLQLKLHSASPNQIDGQPASLDTPTDSIDHNNSSFGSNNQNGDDDEDDDEPLASGTGSVSQECSEIVLANWKELMDKWRVNLDVRPTRLPRLVRRGVPEALRPEIWQLLSGAHLDENALMQRYRAFVCKDSAFEAVINRDISRTFPAHEFFREPGGAGQESLFRICKAYSNYDEEIGYCQGLSFLVAALLLHMPEEQAFCVFVRIMYHYGIRNLFRCGLEELHCKFYQLDRLLNDQMPELSLHFADLNVEAHMYASQWFLTLFTTKFPLNAVFLIIDLFLLDKMDTLLQIALALLKMSKRNLLALDFEGVMKYFRITLPKKYRSDETARELIRTAVKINVKKSYKYEKEYRAWMEKRKQELNPLEHLETENKRLMCTSMRLDQENEDLSQQLFSTCSAKFKLQRDLDLAEEKAETLNMLLLSTRTQLVETEEEKGRLLDEVTNLKEMCRKEIDKYETAIRNERKIIEEYKQICRNYQNKFETERERADDSIRTINETIRSCDTCSTAVTQALRRMNDGNDDDDDDLRQDGDDADRNSESNCSGPPQSIDSADHRHKREMSSKIAELESQLIATKVALAESEDRNGLLMGRLHTTSSELNLLRAQAEEAANQRTNTWFTKTLSSIRDAAKVKPSNSIASGISILQSGTGSGAATGSVSAGASSFASNVEATTVTSTSLYHVNNTNYNNGGGGGDGVGAARRNSSRDIYHP